MRSGNEPMLDIVNGDIGMSRHLSKALAILADSPGIDKDLRQQLRDIREGRGSMRDLAHSEAFTRMSEAAMPSIAAELARRTPEEMQQLARAGEEILAKYRNEVLTTAAPQELAPEGAPPREGRQPVAPAESVVHSRSAAPPGVIPGTRKPDRERIVSPEEFDDDDLYYQERGWLR